MFDNAFVGKTVFVTGHTGFKGAWLALWLERLGARVVGYSLPPPTTPSLFELCGLAELIEHIEGDIRDTEGVQQAICRTTPAFVFHLAACPLVLESYANPLDTFDTNVMGTLSVVEAVRRAARRCAIVVVSTDKCYENQEWPYGYREIDRLGGRDPYSASKAAMEIAIAAYRHAYFAPDRIAEHGVRLATARAGNVIGGGDWAPDRLVPDAVRALSNGEPLNVRNPRSVRPWQHVLEPLSGYLWLAAKLASGGAPFASAWNFGPLPADTHTVAELAEAIIKAWGSGEWRKAQSPDGAHQAPHEAGVLGLAIDKARLYLGWEPVWDFHTAVARTVALYQSLGQSPYQSSSGDGGDRLKNRQSCVADIADYERAAGEKGLAWTF